VPVLIRESHDGEPDENPWGIKFSRMFDMSNDSHRFHTRESLETDGWRLHGNVFRKDGSECLPLYEAKMIHHFDHRWATYEGLDTRDLSLAEKQDPKRVVLGRYWVDQADVQAALASTDRSRGWLLGWRDITNSTNERTIVGGIFPRAAVGNNLPIWACSTGPPDCLASILTSLVCDFAARFKVGGTHLNFFIAEQIPVLHPSAISAPCPWASQSAAIREWLLPRTLELTYTAWDLESFAFDCNWSGPPFRWDEERRFLLRCELDAAFFHLYLPADENGQWRRAEGETAEELARLKASFPTPRDAVAYIMDTFPIVRRKDEARYDGDYRTKRVILEIYDAM